MKVLIMILDYLFQGDYVFISSFLGAIHIPKHKLDNEEDLLNEEVNMNGSETLEEKQKRVRPGETTRANTREELKERLDTNDIVEKKRTICKIQHIM